MSAKDSSPPAEAAADVIDNITGGMKHIMGENDEAHHVNDKSQHEQETQTTEHFDKSQQALIQRAASAISKSTHLFIGAGAGCSADSGMKVFAQISQDTKDEGLTYDQIASGDMLAKNPARCLGFWLTSPYAKSHPHLGYDILSKWRLKAKSEFVVTSNVDGFFVRSLPQLQANVAEIHGTLSYWQCGGVPNQASAFPRWLSHRCSNELFPPPEIPTENGKVVGPIPTCPKCRKGILRPNVYLFGDGDRFADVETVTRAKALQNWLADATAAYVKDPNCRIVIMEIGSGLRVPTIRKRCEELYVSLKTVDPNRVEFIRINPDYPMNPLIAGGLPSIPLKMGALDALNAIDSQMQ
jgi:NAD-dependent SIR2 family protein deacetylase